METFLLVSTLALWAVVLFLGFLVLGTLRAYGVLRWQLEQLAATTPNRVGRSGLKPGKAAPEFTLPRVGGGEVSLRDFAGRPVLLVFVQAGCGPCHAIAPELNRLVRRGVQVVVVNSAEPEAAREWAEDVGAEFPVLVQERWKVSKSYEVYATPFAFLIEGGVVRSNGIASSREYLGYVLRGAGNEPGPDHGGPDRAAAEKGRSEEPVSTKEVSRV
jgi:peroxiredoxin